MSTSDRGAFLPQITEAAFLRDLIKGRFVVSGTIVLAVEAAAEMRGEGYTGRLTVSGLVTAVERRYGPEVAQQFRANLHEAGAHGWGD